MKVSISGVGTASIAGSAPKLTALVRGTSALDASGLAVKDATVGAEGPAQVRDHRQQQRQGGCARRLERRGGGRRSLHGEVAGIGRHHRLLIAAISPELREGCNRYTPRTENSGSEAMYIGIGGLILLIILLVILF